MSFDKLRRRSLLAIFLTVFLDLVGFGMFIPVVVNVASMFGASPPEAASVNTWYSIGTLAAVMILGRLSDQWGRRKLLLLTVALSALAHLATGFAPNLFWLVVVRLIAGAAAGNISVAQAAIADITSAASRSKSMVIIGVAFGGGFAIGPALGAGLARLTEEHVMPAIGLTACALNLINLFVVSRLLPETHPRFASGSMKEMQTELNAKEQPGLHQQDVTAEVMDPTHTSPVNKRDPEPKSPALFQDFLTLVRIPALRITFLMQFLQVFGFVGLETILPIVLKDAYAFSTAAIYDSFVILGISVLAFNGLVTRKLLGILEERVAVKLGQLLLCVGIAGVHLSVPSPSPLYASLVLVAAGTSFTNPAVSSLTSKLCPPGSVGLSFGALQVVGATARILGPVAMGLLYKLLGGSQSLWFTVALIATASLFSFFIPKTGLHRRTPDDHGST
jgi:DHA1 family tetracycline resistance protein-like MFS transporter